MAAQSKTLTFPAPTRLKKSFDLFGYRFEPVPSSLVPRASPNLAWTGFANEWETHAYHHVYLAYFVDLAAQQAKARGLPNQDVWVAVIHHDAYQPSAGPRGTAKVPSCVFGSAISVINAFTGKGVVSAG